MFREPLERTAHACKAQETVKLSENTPGSTQMNEVNYISQTADSVSEIGLPQCEPLPTTTTTIEKTKNEKLAMIVMVLAMITASVTQGGDTIQSHGLVINPISIPWTDGTPDVRFVGDKKYTMVVYLRDGKKRYFVGTYQGLARVGGIRTKVPTEGVTGKGETVVPRNDNGQFYVFKGEHSMLLYRGNTDWLIVEGKIQWRKSSFSAARFPFHLSMFSTAARSASKI